VDSFRYTTFKTPLLKVVYAASKIIHPRKEKY
jgi:hypothetical protein